MMVTKASSLILFLVVGVICTSVFTSGCINNTSNDTWGEKKISIDAMKVSNNTQGEHLVTNEKVYKINGTIINNNPYDALELKIKAITYDNKGNVFAVNDTPYISPKDVPANGISYFSFRFLDPDKKIVRYEVKIESAKSQYF